MSCSNYIPPKTECKEFPMLETMIEHHQKLVIYFFGIEKSYNENILNDKFPKWYRGIFKTWLRKHYQVYNPMMGRLRNRYEFEIHSTGDYPILIEKP